MKKLYSFLNKKIKMPDNDLATITDFYFNAQTKEVTIDCKLQSNPLNPPLQMPVSKLIFVEEKKAVGKMAFIRNDANPAKEKPTMYDVISDLQKLSEGLSENSSMYQTLQLNIERLQNMKELK